MAPQKNKVLKLPTIQRLPNYLHITKQLKKEGVEKVSTTYLADEIKLDSIVVRKDLAITGIVGRPGIGYNVDKLIEAIESFLGWDTSSDAIVVGIDSFGEALLKQEKLEEHGFNVIAGFEMDNTKEVKPINDKQVFKMKDLKHIVKRLNVKLGIICCHPDDAQDAANSLVDAGIEGIWNFTPVNINTPEDVISHQQDLSSGLAILSIKLSKKLTRA